MRAGDFAGLRPVLSKNEREIATEKFAAARADASAPSEVGISERESAAWRAAGDAAKWGTLVLEAYDALHMRVRLAELALYRAGLLADDMESIIERGKTQRAGGPSPEGIANMARRYVRDYVEPVIKPLREALGFKDGDEARGWYLAPEDARAKLVGAERTVDEDRRRRIRSEGGV